MPKSKIKIEVVHGPLDILDELAAEKMADLQRAWIDGHEYVVGQERIQPLLQSAGKMLGRLREALSELRSKEVECAEE